MKKTYKTPKSMFLGMDIDNVILAGSDGDKDKYVPVVPDENAKRFSFGLSDDDDEEDVEF